MKCNTCESNFWRKQSKSKFFPSLETSKQINDTLPTIPSTPLSKLFSFLRLTTLFTTLAPPKKSNPSRSLLHLIWTPTHKAIHLGEKITSKQICGFRKMEVLLENPSKKGWILHLKRCHCGLPFNFSKRPEMAANVNQFTGIPWTSWTSRQSGPAWYLAAALQHTVWCREFYYNMGDVVEKRHPRQWMEDSQSTTLNPWVGPICPPAATHRPFPSFPRAAHGECLQGAQFFFAECMVPFLMNSNKMLQYDTCAYVYIYILYIQIIWIHTYTYASVFICAKV